MYGKFHSSTFTGSMRGAGPVVFAVWGYIIANTNQHSSIELNPEIIAFLLGCSKEEVSKAIEILCAPDPRSRSKAHEGRRLVKDGEYQYFVLTHSQYRLMRTTEELREYNRIKKREQRQRESEAKISSEEPPKTEDVKRDVKNVNDVNTTIAIAITESSNGLFDAEKPPKVRKKFVPPTQSEVQSKMLEGGLSQEEAKTQSTSFINHHTTRGWLLPGKIPMSSWPHAVGTWLSNYRKFKTNPTSKKTTL